MKTRTVLDGNAFYEIDEECLERMQLEQVYEKKTENDAYDYGGKREKQEEMKKK